MSILLVDSRRPLALALQRTLTSVGYYVPITVETGEEALRVARVFRPDLALVDLGVRGLSDGIETGARAAAVGSGLKPRARANVSFSKRDYQQGPVNRTNKLRIFLVDDHQILRDGLKALINAQHNMAVIGEAADGVSAVEGAAATQPDVVVMDISIPKLGGAAATRQIKARCLHTHVVALTAHEESAYAQHMLDAGAAGYVLKRTAAADLVLTIEKVADRGVHVDPAVAGQLVNNVRMRRDVELNGTAELSDREHEVMRLIAEGHSMKAIAAKLGLSVRTIETYKTRAMEKLALGNRADIVRYALRRGWL